MAWKCGPFSLAVVHVATVSLVAVRADVLHRDLVDRAILLNQWLAPRSTVELGPWQLARTLVVR
jgi:hypothetical protein